MIPSKTVQKIDLIETICSQDVGRGIEQMARFSKGGLQGAARSIAFHPAPHVAILTGFYIPHGSPPAPETDGPVGAIHIAAGLSRVGIPVRIVTDSLCTDMMKAAAQAANLPSEVEWDEVPIMDEESEKIVAEILQRWEAAEVPVSHVIAIERVGPAKDGIPYNMRGNNLEPWTAPLHLLYQKSSQRITIGIGDGGNELGMGAIPTEIIRQSVQNGETIACAVPCDHLNVCGVSNWGGFALISAISLLRPDWFKRLTETLTLEQDFTILKEIVQKTSAVDGVKGVPDLSVDGLPWEFHSQVLAKVLEVVWQTEP